MPETTVGLSSHEAKKIIENIGPNVLPEKKPPSNIVIFLSQLKSPLVYVLLFAWIVTFLIGHHTDSAVIAVAIFVNTVLGFIQERKASHALVALKKMIEPYAVVVRDGKENSIEAKFIVPGDVCILNAGDKVPADGKLIFANRLFLSEAILTGESMPVSKEIGEVAFAGTIITSGRGKLLVTFTGAQSEIGKIAKNIQEPSEDTPIRHQLQKFASQLTVLVVILTFTVFLVGLLRNMDPLDIFTTSVALAVSAIPEGLLVGLTVVLAFGMQRILKRKGLVRNLVSAETLGGVTTICVDKTGTLTEGQMKVMDVAGDGLEIAKQGLVANDMDDPIVIAIWEWANKKINWKDIGEESVSDFVRQHARIDSIPFSAKERFFSSLNFLDSKQNCIYVNGAPEYLLDWSTLSKTEKEKVEKEIKRFSERGMRLIAMASKTVPSSKRKLNENDVKGGLKWIGLIALSDPVRPGVKEALEITKKAGIRLVVITGDYVQTAVSVLKELGIHIKEDNILLGEELENLSQPDIASRIFKSPNGMFLFARTTPEQKLKIVESLKQSGEVIAMTGDGVNDALALKKADIGIVVGNATEVAKESADLILLDSSFSTIVAAIEEGRGIFNNIRKIILYLMAGSFSEIIAVLGSLFLGLPLPITAVQILWINLVSDGFPHLSLTVDPRDPKIMNHIPRNPAEPLISTWMKKLIIIVSLFSGFSALFLFLAIHRFSNDLVLAQSVTFLTLGINSLIYIFSVRTLTKPFLSQNPFINNWLNAAVLGGFILQIVPFMTPMTRNFFGLVPLKFEYWVLIFVIGIITFLMIEGFKRLLTFRDTDK